MQQHHVSCRLNSGDPSKQAADADADAAVCRWFSFSLASNLCHG
jgi:hypothetical protein